MASLQGPVVCPTIRSKQAAACTNLVHKPVWKAKALRSRFWGCNGICGLKAATARQLCARRRLTIHCTFSSSSNDNESKAESFHENDEDYVFSSVIEAVEVKSGSDGFIIKMRDGKILKCAYINPQGHLPEYAPHPAIVLKMELGTGILLPIIVPEISSALLIAAIRDVHIARTPIMYNVIKEMVEKMGYVVKLVRVTQRVQQAYFAQIYLTKADNEAECLTFDLRPSDAINIAVRCKVPIQVNKHLAYSDGVRVVEAAKPSTYGPGWDGFFSIEMDRGSGKTSIESEEFNLLRNMMEAANDERYQDAAKWRNELSRLRAKRNWA